MESQENVVINVDPGSEIKIKASKTIHFGQTTSPKSKLGCLIYHRLSKLATDPHNYGTFCIYKVPEKHRKKNQEAYTPQVVSIGPLHHGEIQLQPMEEYKWKYLKKFLDTFRVPLDLLAEHVDRQKELIYGCYEDKYHPDLLEVILLDGVFIVELFLKNHFPEMRERGDTIFENRWVSNDVLHDLMLLENQLPMRFVCTMYDLLAYPELSKNLDDPSDLPSFHTLAYEYFENVGNVRNVVLTPDCFLARHLVEFLAILHSPVYPKDPVEFAKYELLAYWEMRQGNSFKFTRCATATKLLAAGVKFSRELPKCLFMVTFDKEKGELEIPQLTINGYTETFFRNLIAFEHCGYSAKYITSYVILMDNLIDTAKDVDILVEHEIITNLLGSSEQVAHVFNNLYNEIVTDPKEFYFAGLCIELNEYRRDLWYRLKSKLSKWFAMLQRDYFSSPWSIISVIAAGILLVLTVIQTVCSVLQV